MRRKMLVVQYSRTQIVQNGSPNDAIFFDRGGPNDARFGSRLCENVF